MSLTRPGTLFSLGFFMRSTSQKEATNNNATVQYEKTHLALINEPLERKLQVSSTLNNDLIPPLLNIVFDYMKYDTTPERLQLEDELRELQKKLDQENLSLRIKSTSLSR
jgi:hypothetical protein